jgi:uncharacterized protein (TIGR02996 family)
VSNRAEVLGLLADIKREPYNYSLRLILADWLEDHATGEADLARATLLRHQVRGGADPGTRQLTSKHLAAWLGLAAPWCLGATVRGGLLSVRLDGSSLASTAFQGLANSETWAWVDELEIRSPLPRRISQCPLLFHLHSLILPQLPHGGAIADLATAAWLQNIHRLDLTGGSFRALDAEELFTSPHLTNLRELIWSRHPMNRWSLRALAEQRQLRRLILSRNHLGDTEAQALAGVPTFASLEELDLTDNFLRDAGAFALAESPYLGQLRLLTLFGNPLGVEGRRRLRERFGPRVLFVE